MILLKNVTHFVKVTRPILHDVSAVLPGDKRIAVFGNRESGKTTMAKIISGALPPKMGMVIQKLRVSYPVGAYSDFSQKASVAHNLADIARSYGVNARALTEFVVEAGDAQMFLHRPIAKLTSTEKTRLFFPLVYALPFDFYVLDGQPGGAVQAYKERFEALFQARIKNKGMIMFTNKPKQALKYCDTGAILHNGRFVIYKSLKEAVQIYERHIQPLEVDPDASAPKALPAPTRQAEMLTAPKEGIYL
ncbi:MAG: hypothetical protein MRY63_08520 [Neomegalonema sp.]|nr:hypothetical protein [Neomegalonema sp.]